MNRARCKWCLGDELLLSYHDQEWGVLLHNDKKHFEYITLEVMWFELANDAKKRDIIRDSFRKYNKQNFI